MENKILEQIKKSETAMLDTLAQIVNIDSGYDAYYGIFCRACKSAKHFTFI